MKDTPHKLLNRISRLFKIRVISLYGTQVFVLVDLWKRIGWKKVI